MAPNGRQWFINMRARPVRSIASSYVLYMVALVEPPIATVHNRLVLLNNWFNPITKNVGQSPSRDLWNFINTAQNKIIAYTNVNYLLNQWSETAFITTRDGFYQIITMHVFEHIFIPVQSNLEKKDYKFLFMCLV